MNNKLNKTISISKSSWLVIPFVIVLLLFQFVLMSVRVDGSSMYPTLKDGVIGITLRTTISNDIQHFDIVVVKSEATSGNYLVKRVIGLPGDKVELINGVLYLNSKRTEESYVNHKNKDTTGMVNLTRNASIILSEDQYYLLGDNRDNSIDSRVLGVFKKEDIKGINFYGLTGKME